MRWSISSRRTSGPRRCCGIGDRVWRRDAHPRSTAIPYRTVAALGNRCGPIRRPWSSAPSRTAGPPATRGGSTDTGCPRPGTGPARRPAGPSRAPAGRPALHPRSTRDPPARRATGTGPTPVSHDRGRAAAGPADPDRAVPQRAPLQRDLIRGSYPAVFARGDTYARQRTSLTVTADPTPSGGRGSPSAPPSLTVNGQHVT